MDLFRRRGDAGVWVSRAAPGERSGRTGAGPPERERFSPIGLLCRMIYSWRHMAALGALFRAVHTAPICVAAPRGPQPCQSPG